MGEQARDEFAEYRTPKSGRRFTELYNVQHLSSSHIDEVARVTICTIQRLYSILRGEELAEGADDLSGAELARVFGGTSRAGKTTGSGESVAIAFRGRPSTRSFGETTSGRTTANRAVPLADGKMMWLGAAHQADRNGRLYIGPVEPDVPLRIDWRRFASDDDPVLAAATAWLRRQPQCAPRK